MCSWFLAINKCSEALSWQTVIPDGHTDRRTDRRTDWQMDKVICLFAKKLLNNSPYNNSYLLYVLYLLLSIYLLCFYLSSPIYLFIIYLSIYISIIDIFIIYLLSILLSSPIYLSIIYLSIYLLSIYLISIYLPSFGLNHSCQTLCVLIATEDVKEHTAA